ncbi:MAG TPA: TrmH family RNA methyltransferase [Clostridiales bacterium]|jgi:TrmH family RNA methyltransferase|nr:TrmH family RNA methyltransferase [Clostridiales bacterium]
MEQTDNDRFTEHTQIKPYKKDALYSYTLGAFPTYELILSKPEAVLKVLIHSGYTDADGIKALCTRSNIPIEVNNKLIGRLSDKENCYVVGVFKKYSCRLAEDKPHIVLVNPSNMGNLGTILRTIVGFGIYDIAIVLPGADIFHPKSVRASMGALFKLNFQLYDSFDDYRSEFNKHELFTFMINKENTQNIKNCPKPRLFSLVFGNEATGLDDSYLNVGTSVMIPQTADVDSLNLTIAVGIGVYEFTR